MKNKADMAKIKSYSHNLKIVMNVFYWASVIFACASAIAAVVIRLLPDAKFILDAKNIGHLGFSLDGLIRYSLNGIVSPGISVKGIYFNIMVMSTVILILLIPIFRQLCLILKSVEMNMPFAVENSKRISTIGFILMAAAFVIPAAEVFVAGAMIDILKIQNISTNYSVNLVLILTGFMMFVLGGIFKYGSYLQHEYDETV